MWADKLLEWYCSSHYLEEVQGALYEYFYERVAQGNTRQARRYYVLDVLMHCRPYLIKRNKNSTITRRMDQLKNYAKISFRNLWAHRLTSSLNILGLTIGITASLLITLWVSHEVTFDRFHQSGERIYRIANTFRSESEEFSQALSGPAIGAQLDDIFADVAKATRFVTSSAQVQVGYNNFFENRMAAADPAFFEIFDYELLKGNREQLFDDINSIVITEHIAKKYFGDADPLGQSVKIDNQQNLTVSGVLKDIPSNSQMQFDMIVSMDLLKKAYNLTQMDEEWGGGWFHTYLMLGEQADKSAVEADINAFMASKLTWFTERNMSYEYFLQPLTSIHLNSDLRYDFSNNGSIQNVRVFSIVAVIVLLLAIINYINLFTASAISRAKEVGVKKVVGASRGDLILQYLTESVLTVMLTTLLSVGLLFLVLPYFEHFLGHGLPLPKLPQSLLFLTSGALLVGVSAGLLPAMSISSFKPLKVMRGQLRTGKKGVLLRKSLVVIQFSASLTLMMAIFTVYSQMEFVRTRDIGLAKDEILHVGFRGIQSVTDNSEVLRGVLTQQPAIQSVSFQRFAYPVGGLSNGTVMVEKGDGTEVSSSLYHMWVDEAYARTFGLEVLAGRFFSPEFPADSTNAVIVNQSALTAFGWESPESAIGRKMGNDTNRRTVIGVVKDFHFEGLHKNVEPLRILPADPTNYSSLAVRANLRNPMPVLAAIEDAWSEINPTVPLDITFMNEDLRQQYELEYAFRTIFLVFSLISIAIACLGLFGLATFSINQRVKEIGIRKVLGAKTLLLISLLNRDFVTLIALSVLVAAPLAWYGSEQWLDNFAVRIEFSLWFVLLAAMLTLALTISIASYRAVSVARRNPARSLRYE